MEFAQWCAAWEDGKVTAGTADVVKVNIDFHVGVDAWTEVVCRSDKTSYRVTTTARTLPEAAWVQGVTSTGPLTIFINIRSGSRIVVCRFECACLRSAPNPFPTVAQQNDKSPNSYSVRSH